MINTSNMSSFSLLTRLLARAASLTNMFSPIHAVAFLFLSGSLVVAILYSLSFRNSDNLLDRQRQALQAILYFVSPTCSLWSATYVSIAQSAASSANKAVRLPLRALLDDSIAGKLQFRDAGLDLPALVTKSLKAHDWSILLQVEMRWWATVLGWIAASHFTFMKSYSFVWTNSQVPNKTNTTRRGTSVGASSVSWGSTDLDHLEVEGRLPAHTLSLDTVPYLHLETFIRAMQASLSPGASITITFTTRCASISFASTSFILAALPFLPRRYMRQEFGHVQLSLRPASLYALSPDIVRTTTPLFASLSYVLGLVTSGQAPLVVHSLRNITEQQAALLNAYAKSLEEDPRVRDDFVRRWGLRGWREEMVYNSWEAALLTARSLERWAVTVRRAG